MEVYIPYILGAVGLAVLYLVTKGTVAGAKKVVDVTVSAVAEKVSAKAKSKEEHKEEKHQ